MLNLMELASRAVSQTRCSASYDFRITVLFDLEVDLNCACGQLLSLECLVSFAIQLFVYYSCLFSYGFAVSVVCLFVCEFVFLSMVLFADVNV